MLKVGRGFYDVFFVFWRIVEEKKLFWVVCVLVWDWYSANPL